MALEAAGELRGVGGQRLPGPVTVVTTDGAGQPEPGTAVELETPDGGSVTPASATTDAAGRLEVAWRLAPVDSVRRQHLVARADGGSSADTLEATVRPPPDDVVIVRGAEGPLKGILVTRQIGLGLEIFEEHVRPDTVVDLRPRLGGGAGAPLVAVFPSVSPPVLRPVEWTPGADSVVVELPPPVGIDLEVRIHAAPFEETEAIAREHLAATREIWEREGVGLVVDSVRFLDRTDGPPVHLNRTEIEASCDQPPGKTITVDYVDSIDREFLDGYGCPPDNVFMGVSSGDERNVLAHELGHVFTLNHTQDGLMQSAKPGAALTEGQIFRIHFDEDSGVNTVFDAHPEEVRRRCPGGCLGTSFEIGS